MCLRFVSNFLNSHGPHRDMRVFMAVRLFSGFQSSVNDRKWHPSGSPTIYKLLEQLVERGDDLQIVFTSKSDPDPCGISIDQLISIDGLGEDVTVLAGPAIVRNWPKKLRWYLSELRQTWVIWRKLKEFQPDIIYLDRGNVIAAGLFARFSSVPVVYRIMGVTPDLSRAWHPRSVFHRIVGWLLRSPFALAICSQDGSGGELWLDRLLDNGTPRTMLLNGVDLPISLSSDNTLSNLIPQGKTIVLWLGRIDKLKCPMEFLEGFQTAVNMRPGQLHALVIGDGDLSETVRKSAEENGLADDITFVGSVDHHTALTAYALADIYVSLNSQGNLSNSNLEAFKSGCCSIVPASDPETGRDSATDQLFPEPTLLRIELPVTASGISQAILYLHDNPDVRNERARITRTIAETVITGWQPRIDLEISKLESLL
jgi:glycosyltransferase involved in cell wall biosynthesis